MGVGTSKNGAYVLIYIFLSFRLSVSNTVFGRYLHQTWHVASQ